MSSLALSVVGDYNIAREEPGPYVDLSYRPVSDLPYPQSAIRRCCDSRDPDFRRASGDHRRRSGAARDRSKWDVLGVALFSLDYFLDAPADELPREKAETWRTSIGGSSLRRRRSRSQARVKSLSPEHGVSPYLVSEVIGVGEKDQLDGVTKSGASMQVRRNAESGNWEEVSVVAPAAASWLTLTPSAGVPKWASS